MKFRWSTPGLNLAEIQRRYFPASLASKYARAQNKREASLKHRKYSVGSLKRNAPYILVAFDHTSKKVVGAGIVKFLRSRKDIWVARKGRESYINYDIFDNHGKFGNDIFIFENLGYGNLFDTVNWDAIRDIQDRKYTFVSLNETGLKPFAVHLMRPKRSEAHVLSLHLVNL